MAKKYIALILVLCMACMALAGCGSTTEAPAQDAGTTEVVEEKGSDFVIGLSNNVIGNSWRAQFLQGVDDARERLVAEGLVKDIIVANCDSDLNKQLDDINAMIQDGCDAILINAVSETALSEVIAKAVDAGIQVYIINDAAAYEDTIAIIGDAEGVWEPVVRYFAESYPEEGGNYIYISGVPGLSTDTARTNVVE